jgi:outer membrane protein assembly factor BamB
MGEYPNARPDLEDLHWNDGGTPETKTEPNESKKDGGFIYKGIPPYDEFNWRWYWEYQFWAWIDAIVPRIFSTLKEGIDVVASPRLFRVHPPAGGMKARADQVFSVQGTLGAYAVTDGATDGRRVYYLQSTGPGSGKCYGADPEDGSLDWTYDLSYPIDAVAADGRNVYICSGEATRNVVSINRTTGAEIGYATIAYGTGFDACANGDYLVVCHSQYTDFFDNLGGTPNNTGTVARSATANNYACAIDALKVYVGGTRGTDSYDVYAYLLSSRATSWQVALPTTGTATINAIATDGDLVYVATDRIALTAGGDACLFVLSARNGSLLWTYDLGSGVNLDYIAHDDLWIFASDDANTTYCFHKTHRAPLWVIANFHAFEADGVGIVGGDGNNIERKYRGTPMRTFQVVKNVDANRRPFHHLAIPVDDNL